MQVHRPDAVTFISQASQLGYSLSFCAARHHPDTAGPHTADLVLGWISLIPENLALQPR